MELPRDTRTGCQHVSFTLWSRESLVPPERYLSVRNDHLLARDAMTRLNRIRSRTLLHQSGLRVIVSGLLLVLVSLPAAPVPADASDTTDVETRIKVAFVYNF